MSDLERGDGFDHAIIKDVSKECLNPHSTPMLSSHRGHDDDDAISPSKAAKSQTASVVASEVDDIDVVSWDSPSDPANPVNWPLWRRWTLISIVSALNFVAGIGSSMFAPGIPDLLAEYNSSNSTLGSFAVTVFILGLATGPLLFAPLSEIYGRLVVQHVGSIGFTLFSIACALSPSLEVLIGMRLLQGVFAASQLTNGGAIIADMVPIENRGFAMAMFTLGVLLAPSAGPVAGGYISAAKGWRWIFWTTGIMLGLFTIPCLVFWRESYAPVLLERKAANLRRETGNPKLRSKYDVGLSPQDHFKRAVIRPMKMLIFSPTILLLSLFMGLAYSYLFLLFTTMTPVYEENYHFSPRSVGLSYLGIGVGFLLGQFVFTQFGDVILKKLAAKTGGEIKPEYRLPLCCICGVFIPIGLFWYGWSAQAKVFWIIPILGTSLIGFANSLVFICIQAYVIDAFTLYAASGLATITIVRCVMATTLPLAGPKMYAALGLGWGNSLLAFVALAMTPVPILLFFYGERMRTWNSERIRTL